MILEPVQLRLRAGLQSRIFILMELELNPFIFIRFLNIQYAVYTAETGDQIGDSPDKRKVIQINFGF